MSTSCFAQTWTAFHCKTSAKTLHLLLYSQRSTGFRVRGCATGMVAMDCEVAVIPNDDPWGKFKANSSVSAQPKPVVVSQQPTTLATPPSVAATVEVNDLTFHYPDIDGRPLANTAPVVQHMTCSIPAGSRVLLTGPNGAGKTTLLKILGGKHMVPESSLKVMGQPPFHSTALTSRGALSYVGGNWERDVAFAGYAVPLQGDIPAGQMLSSIPHVDPKRREKLIEVLDINPAWRMHLVSDGQRRRVQIAMGLLKEFEVLLLDEITVDLDVLGRADLMNYLKEETDRRKATVIYATHIFDGLEGWPTHIMYVSNGQLKVFGEAKDMPELQSGQLLELIERWLRADKAVKDAERKAAAEAAAKAPQAEQQPGKDEALASWNNGWAAGRLTSTIKHASNAVWRM